MTTEETTGGINMTTEQTTNTVIGNIENQNTVTMTQEAYDANIEIREQENQRLAAQIIELSNDIESMRMMTVQGMVKAQLEVFDFNDTIASWMDCNISDYIHSWVNHDLNDYIESWADDNINSYIDTDDIARDAAEYVEIDANQILDESLGSMCDSGKQQVAILVNELIADGRIILPEEPVEHAQTLALGLDQQAIYTALDQIRGGVTALLAYMDANPPEVTE